MATKALLILSGGMDSTTLLYHLISMGKDVRCLTFNYGQRHLKEIDNIPEILEHAENTFGLERYSILHDVIDLSGITHLIAGQSGLVYQGDIPDCHYTAESAKKTVVPGRNLIMLSIAASIAEANDIPELYYAAHSGDWEIYPDCRFSFVKAAKSAILQSSAWKPVELKAPFSILNKGDIVRVGLKLSVPYNLTWSCYNGREKACGTCPTCIERLEAFQSNNVTDPIEYEV